MRWPLRLPSALALAASLASPSLAVDAPSGEAELPVELVSSERLEALLVEQICPGPLVVLFGRGGSTLVDRGEETDALLTFAAVAKELSGLACFKAVNCGRWPDMCANYNVRPPAVLLFGKGLSLTKYLGHLGLDSKTLLSEVARLVIAGDRTLQLEGENAATAWLQGTLRPVKVVMVSKKTGTRTVFKALSADRRLWPHMDFGFVQESDRSVVKYFTITDSPAIVVQCGEDTEQRLVYDGADFGFHSLLVWLLGLIRGEGAPFEKCLSDATLLAEVEEAEELPVLEETQLPYERLEYGANGCPPGHEIKSVQECEEAIKALGFDVEPRWVSIFPELPQGCSIREETSDNGREHMHFNSAKTGKGREDLAPICKVPVEQPQQQQPSNSNSKAPQSQSNLSPNPKPNPNANANANAKAAKARPPTPIKTQTQSKGDDKDRDSDRAQQQRQGQDNSAIPELSKANYAELLGAEGFCFVYLRRGTITGRETAMLLEIRQQFSSQIKERGIKLRWAWLDLQVERKLKQVFNPPALPSALVLNPHKQPRFVLAQHDEKDGEATSIGAAGIIRMLNQLLGGDAKFTRVSFQKIIAFVDRATSRRQEKGKGKTKADEERARRREERRRQQEEFLNRRYQKLEFGAQGCPDGTQIDSMTECERAIKSLGLDTEPKWVSVYPHVPKGCSVREDLEHGSERLHFNSAAAGQGRRDLAPICREPLAEAGAVATDRGAAPAVGEQAEGSDPGMSALPQLAGKNHRELFGGDGLSFIYLQKGAISREEVNMLLGLQTRFQGMSSQRPVRLGFMWLDVRVERKLADAFDPEVLPSAVVLDPHKKPRFAMLRHEERDGEPLPADEAAIMLLLTTVLSGDAEFRSLPAQKLAVWADGTVV